MTAPQKIIELVEDFTENKYEYTNPEVFDEENTKVKFLNPFFEELGWNVRNEGLSARFREVVFDLLFLFYTKYNTYLQKRETKLQQ